MKKAVLPILPSLLAICSLALSGATALGQAAAADKPKPLAAQDKKFIKDAGESVYYVLKLADMGKKSKDTGTKGISDAINTDGTKIWEELATHAQKHDEKLPVELSASDKGTVERLGKVKEAKQDKQLLKELSKEVKKLVLTFETVGKSGQDVDIKALGEKWTPTLKKHLESADKAEAEAGKRK
jgi:predicted outer membrane protein